MKSRMMIMALIMILGISALSAAMKTSPGWSYGYELGLSRGDNAGSAENFAPIGRGHVQLELFPFLFTRLGVGYTPLHASKTYSTSTVLGDSRFIFNPMHEKKYSPFVYGGVGGTLDLKHKNADMLPMYSAGLGLQTLLKPGTNLEVTLGYNLSNTDKLDGRIRTDDTNTFTGKKQDGFYALTVGLSFFNPGPQAARPAPAPAPAPPLTLRPTPPPPAPAPVIERERPPVDLRAIDSDGDGLSDYDEINVYKTDPNKADTDGDGLSDYAEVMQYKTDPLKVDTDGDGLSDYAEVMQYKTDPLKVDTDGDGLSDYAEVMQYKTNPLVKDTDGGSVNDGEEVAAGTNPLDPRDDVLDLHEGASFSLEGILFETGSANIKAESIPILEQAYAALAANRDVKVLITGHTDNVGSAQSNMTLSQNRANSVRTWLVNRGIAADRLRAEGRGLTQPRATNNTPEGRALNRRIEFMVE